MAAALISALTQKAVRRDVAADRRNPLRGRILPIGELKERCLRIGRAFGL